jgi:hypothetical protein
MAETRGKNKNLVEAGNPRLLKKEVKGGTEYSLYLEYQLGYNRENGASIRKKETLSLYLKANPRTPVERQQNKGHSSLRFTEIYVRAVDEEKKKAINSMPSIDIL